MKKNLTFLTILLVVFLMPFTAMAGSYTIDDILFNNAGSAKYKLNGSDTTHSSSVGAFTVTFEDFDEIFAAFCIDPDQSISPGTNLNLEVELVSAGTVAGGLESAWLLKKYGKNDAAAMQVALWEVVKDDNDDHIYNLDDGQFQLVSAGSGVRDLANSYLSDLSANFDADGLDALFMASKHPSKQDFIYLGTALGGGAGSVDTPEPATMLLLGFGIIGLAGLRKKIRKS